MFIGLSSYLDAYHERKKILQHELKALEREAEARWCAVGNCYLICAIYYIIRPELFSNVLNVCLVSIISGMSESKQLLMQPQPHEKAGNMYVSLFNTPVKVAEHSFQVPGAA